MFDHEKLDVYHLELKFIGWVTPLVEEVCRSATGKTAEVRDQLDRASLSALLNTAEGNGKRQRQVRAKFFDDARGSATECAACLDALVAKQAATEERVVEGRKLLLRIVSMLCGLIDRFDGSTAFHEESVEYRSGKPEAGRKADYCSKVSRTRTRTSRI
ncbi:MAG: four helix bundle protein [Limisphaerales bacterium]